MEVRSGWRKERWWRTDGRLREKIGYERVREWEAEVDPGGH